MKQYEKHVKISKTCKRWKKWMITRPPKGLAILFLFAKIREWEWTAPLIVITFQKMVFSCDSRFCQNLFGSFFYFGHFFRKWCSVLIMGGIPSSLILLLTLIQPRFYSPRSHWLFAISMSCVLFHPHQLYYHQNSTNSLLL